MSKFFNKWKYNLDKFSYQRKDFNEHSDEVRKEKFKFFLLKMIYFWIFIIWLIIFIWDFNNYLLNKKFEDNDVFVKQLNSIWYNVYDKNWSLEEVKFFNQNVNSEIIWYINNNLIYNFVKDNKKRTIIINNSTSFSSLFEENKKPKEEELEWVVLLWLQKISNDNFIVLFRRENQFCIMKNTLDFSTNKKDKEYCIPNNQKIDDIENANFFVSLYEDYYLIILNDSIYVLNNKKEKIDIKFKSKYQIHSIKKNTQKDIKISTKWNKEYILSKIIIDYYFIQKVSKTNDILVLDLDNMFR